MKKILKKKFFERSAITVAEELIGMYLIRKVGDEIYEEMITEAEAYEGPDDLASHASKGKTPRTEVMFGEAGILYIYFIYGMYNMLNIVTGRKDHPSAVLIRGTEHINGPGRLTKALQIDRRANKKKAEPETGVWFEDRGIKIDKKLIKKTARIGVSYAGPVWEKKEYRFVLEHTKEDKNSRKK